VDDGGRDRLLDCYPVERKSENMPLNAKKPRGELLEDWTFLEQSYVVEQPWSKRINELADENAIQENAPSPK